MVLKLPTHPQIELTLLKLTHIIIINLAPSVFRVALCVCVCLVTGAQKLKIEQENLLAFYELEEYDWTFGITDVRSGLNSFFNQDYRDKVFGR